MRSFIAALVGAVCLAMPASALAVAEVEPNNGIWEAGGPLVAGTPITGSVDSSDDRDVYIVHASGAGVLSVKLTNTTDPADEFVSFYLADAQGDTLNNYSVADGANKTIDYTTPGPGTYYVRAFSDSGGNAYRLDATGPAVDGPTPGAAETVPNNNRDMTTAFGPLAGDHLYGGSIDSYDEQDWFSFYTSGAGQIDLATTSMDGNFIGVALYDAEGSQLQSDSVPFDRTRHITYSAPGPIQLFIRMTGDAGYRYRFQVSPASLLTSTPPPPAVDQAACDAANNAVAKAKAKVKKRKDQLHDAHGHKAKKKAKKKLKKAKKKLKKARQHASDVCLT